MIRLFILSVLLTLTAGCGNKAEIKNPPQATLITVSQAQSQKLEIVEETVGSLESLVDPTIAAEVAGKVLKVLAYPGTELKVGQLMALLDSQDLALARQAAAAEVKRLEALISNQSRQVERLKQLKQANFISQNALDDASAQQNVLKEQLEAARAQLAMTDRSLAKTSVVSPIDAKVEKQIVSGGEYVKVGDPLFQIVTTQRLRARLPFPESAAPRLRQGLSVRLSTPTAPDKPVSAEINEIRPMTGATNRAVEVLVKFENGGGWKPGSSVNGVVVVGEKSGAVMVPEQSVVLRPAGKVVYAIQDGKALQRVVESGVKQGGLIEIVSGLAAGETVAVDGAGFLTDKAAVTVKDDKK